MPAPCNACMSRVLHLRVLPPAAVCVLFSLVSGLDIKYGDKGFLCWSAFSVLVTALTGGLLNAAGMQRTRCKCATLCYESLKSSSAGRPDAHIFWTFYQVRTMPCGGDDGFRYFSAKSEKYSDESIPDSVGFWVKSTRKHVYNRVFGAFFFCNSNCSWKELAVNSFSLASFIFFFVIFVSGFGFNHVCFRYFSPNGRRDRGQDSVASSRLLAVFCCRVRTNLVGSPRRVLVSASLAAFIKVAATVVSGVEARGLGPFTVLVDVHFHRLFQFHFQFHFP